MTFTLQLLQLCINYLYLFVYCLCLDCEDVHTSLYRGRKDWRTLDVTWAFFCPLFCSLRFFLMNRFLTDGIQLIDGWLVVRGFNLSSLDSAGNTRWIHKWATIISASHLWRSFIYFWNDSAQFKHRRLAEIGRSFVCEWILFYIETFRRRMWWVPIPWDW